VDAATHDGGLPNTMTAPAAEAGPSRADLDSAA
jgi:hypothetical protein